MSLLKNLQVRLLKRDVLKFKSADLLAKKYPMSLLIQNGIFERVEGTELYRANTAVNDLYNINGEVLGYPCEFGNSESNNYLILAKEDGKFANSTSKETYAVYDKMGNCIVPHNCYSNCFVTEDYAILSTAMEGSKDINREGRIQKEGDANLVLSSTPKTLAETLGGSTKNPKALIVSKDSVIATNYLSVQPLRVFGDMEVYPNNTIWISQNQKEEEITFKLDKNLHITETYRFTLYSHLFEMFFIDGKTNAVYFLDTENKRRINLRTGACVNLLNLKRSRLSKKERLAELQQEQSLEEVREEKNEENTELSVVGDDEIGDYDPSLDKVEEKDKLIVLGDCVISVGPNAEVAEQTEETIEDVNNI